MKRARSGWVQTLASILVIAQAAAYAAAPYVEALSGAPLDSAPHVERDRGGQCVVAHRPDNCLVCQFLTLRSRVAGAAAPAVPALAPVSLREVAQAATQPSGATRGTALRSRAPPPASA